MKFADIVAALERAGIDDAPFEAALILEHCMGIKRYEINICRDRDYVSGRLSELLLRRCRREPLQYLFGSWYFYGREFVLNRSTLIPRPDTEITVEKASELLPEKARFCDIGTGSGAIAVTVLAERTDTTAVATDISPEALAAASENALRLGVADRLITVHNDILKESEALTEAHSPFDAVVSNPPYIPTEEIKRLEPELAYEPSAALDGGADGMTFYRAIISACRGRLLSPGGLLIFEAGIGEAADIIALGGASGFSGSAFRDLSGTDRCVVLRKKKSEE